MTWKASSPASHFQPTLYLGSLATFAEGKLSSLMIHFILFSHLLGQLKLNFFFEFSRYSTRVSFELYFLCPLSLEKVPWPDNAGPGRLTWNKKDTRSFFFSFIFISLRLITLQYCSGFCHILTWISHGFTCVPHPNPPSHLPLHPLPLGLPSAPGPSTCLMHPTWAGDMFHYR